MTAAFPAGLGAVGEPGWHLLAPGAAAASLAIARAQLGLSTALAANGSSWLVQAADAPRFHGPAQRLLIEGPRGNLVGNPRLEGALAGSPGTPPTGIGAWATGASGLTAQIVSASVTVAGMTGIRTRIAGTAAAAATLTLDLGPGAAGWTPAAAGEAWVGAVFVALAGGSLGGIGGLALRLDARAGTASAGSVDGADARGGLSATPLRLVAAHAALPAGSTGLLPQLRLQVASGAAIDITLDLFWPTLEQGGFASTPVLPPAGAPAASSRAADLVSAPWSGPGTLLWHGVLAQGVGSAERVLVQLDDGSDANAVRVRIPAGGGSLLGGRVNGGVAADATALGSFAPGTPLAVALSWDGAGNLAACLGAGPVRSVAGGPAGGLTCLRLGNAAGGQAPLFGEVGALAVLPFALPAAALPGWLAHLVEVSSVLAPANTALPSISGTARVGQTLTASSGSWDNAPTGYAYQWRRAGSDIAGATASLYTLVEADFGQPILCRVTASNAGGSTSADSASVTPAAAAGLLDGRTDIAAVYGMRRLRSAHGTGPALDLLRISDGATTTVSFAAGDNAISGSSPVSAGGTLAGWLAGGGNSTGAARVTKWYDQSGNGHHATQTTADRRPAILLGENCGNTLGLLFPSGTLAEAPDNGGMDKFLVIPDSLTIADRRAMSVFAFVGVNSHLAFHGIVTLRDSAQGSVVPHVLMVNTAPAASWTPHAAAPTSAVSTEAGRATSHMPGCASLVCNDTPRVSYAGSSEQGSTAVAAGSLMGGYIGALNSVSSGPFTGSVFSFHGDMGCVVILNAAPGTSEAATLRTEIETEFGRPAPTGATVWHLGDSGVEGTKTTFGRSCTRRFFKHAAAQGMHLETFNWGRYGDAVGSLIGRISSGTAARIRRGSADIVTILCGSNDLSGGATAAALFGATDGDANSLRLLIANLASYGYARSRIGVYTIRKNVAHDAAKEAQRQALNTLIRGNAGSSGAALGYFVIDAAANAYIGDYAGNAAYWNADNIHLNDAGQQVQAELEWAAVAPLLA